MRRRDAWDASSDVKHAHSYALHNPFFSGGAAVPLPELDAVIGHVAETFEVRKVLARRPSAPADDLVAVTAASVEGHWEK